MMGSLLHITPPAGLEIIAGLPPVDILAMEYACRSWNEGINPPIWDSIGHGHKRGHLRLAGGLACAHTDRVTPSYQEQPRFQINWYSFQTGSPVICPQLTAYTDGSKLLGSEVGVGYSIISDVGEP